MNRKIQSFLEASWLKWLWTMKLEAFFFLLALVGFFLAMPTLRALDSTAAGLDAGVLTFAIVGVVSVISAVILFWVLIRAMVPYVDRWFDGALKDEFSPAFRISFEEDWRLAGPAVRLACFVALFATVVLGVSLVTAAAF
jgi:hypothetical protein